MKKTIGVVRHAKSSWAQVGQDDFDRPLNERGKHDAPMMGERLLEVDMVPDLIISSTAVRAKATAKAIAEALHLKADQLKFEPSLYHCSETVFKELITQLDDKYQTVFFVAHNPGVTAFANTLNDDFILDNMPTCGVVIAAATVPTWKDFVKQNSEVIYFDYPKNR